jgi:hypothetical protein
MFCQTSGSATARMSCSCAGGSSNVGAGGCTRDREATTGGGCGSKGARSLSNGEVARLCSSSKHTRVGAGCSCQGCMVATRPTIGVGVRTGSAPPSSSMLNGRDRVHLSTQVRT